MSKEIQKKSHWTCRLKECLVARDVHGKYNVELSGGAEIGEFPYIGEVDEDNVLYQHGRLAEGDLILEVGGLLVPGLPLYDILAMMKNCKHNVEFRTVRQGRGCGFILYA